MRKSKLSKGLVYWIIILFIGMPIPSSIVIGIEEKKTENYVFVSYQNSLIDKNITFIIGRISDYGFNPWVGYGFIDIEIVLTINNFEPNFRILRNRKVTYYGRQPCFYGELFVFGFIRDLNIDE